MGKPVAPSYQFCVELFLHADAALVIEEAREVAPVIAYFLECAVIMAKELERRDEDNG